MTTTPKESPVNMVVNMVGGKIAATRRFLDKRYPEQTWREFAYGQAAGRLMVRAGRLAEARGDIHELRHCAAALAAGDTGRHHEADDCLAILVLNIVALRRHGTMPFGEEEVAGEDRPA